MAEISSDEPPPAVPGRQNPPRAPITDIKQWLEKYSLMAAVLVSRFPEKAPELFAYQATIIRAERNFEGQQWVEYDRQFRREALAGKSLDWSIPNHRLYQEAFTGRARNIPRCSYCVQDDHTSELCTKNPARACFGWPAGFLVWPAVQPPPHFSHPRLAAALPRAMPPLQQRPMLCRPVQIHTCLHRMWRGASHERLPSCPLGTARKSSFPAEGPTTWLPTARLPPAQPADAEPSDVKTST